MALVTLREIQLGFGGEPLLDGVNLNIEPGERIALIGRNGVGKSTLMKLLSGELHPDDGEIVRRPSLKVARLTQEVPEGFQGPVFDLVAGGLEEVGALISRWHHLSHALEGGDDERLVAELAEVQHALEAADGWQLEQKVERVVSRLSLDPELAFETLSGGLKRRVLLARALVQDPDLLLLDEPTNHLDIESIEWLEGFLEGYAASLLFVTHDRRFLRRLATRILELDRGCLSDWPGDYDNFLRRKEEALHAEAQENARFDKKLAEEEVWIRQGIKARRTRNEGRVRALKAMREERRRRREQMGTAHLRLEEAERSGKLVVEAEQISYSWDGWPLVRDFSTVIMRGDKVGLIGPNGVGKTTLLQLLLGRLQPDSGRVRLGTRLEVAYFDQLRAGIDEEQSVQDNVGGGSEKVTINGQSKHIIAYLKDFLFTPERARTPVKALSGGERNRLLLAKLFTRPANVLVMDEPTNDLDTETLELLEELLVNYQGTLLLVSHDRDFLDHVVTSSLVFEGGGRISEYVGGYSDWLLQRSQAKAPEAKPAARKSEAAAKPDHAAKRPAKLSYKDQRELDMLPSRIEALEAELEQIDARLADPEFYRQAGEEIAVATARREEVSAELSHAYARWESLEAMKEDILLPGSA